MLGPPAIWHGGAVVAPFHVGLGRGEDAERAASACMWAFSATRRLRASTIQPNGAGGLAGARGGRSAGAAARPGGRGGRR